MTGNGKNVHAIHSFEPHYTIEFSLYFSCNKSLQTSNPHSLFNGRRTRPPSLHL